MILRPWWLLLYQILISCQSGLTQTASSCETCSLSLLCWARGGVSAGGCGGPTWLYSCCVESVNRLGPFRPAFRFIDSSEEDSDEQENYQKNEIGPFRFTAAHQQFLRNLARPASSFRNQISASPPAVNRYPARSPAPQISGAHSHIVQQPPRNAVQRSSQKTGGIQYHPNQATMLTMSGNYVPAQCGIQPLKNGLQKRIIGGSQAVFGEYPWQAHIRIAGFQCGGVLVNRQYIATAAHCVHRAKLSQIVVYLGEYDTRDTDESVEPLPKETLGVIERKIHPRFQYMLTQPDRFDVALLKLSRPVQYRENILPICLPPPGKDYETAVGVVAGWGKTDTSFGKTGTNILQKVYVPIINNAECYGWHERKGIVLELHEEMFCAGHEMGQMDACLGDSGGPLVVNEGGRWTLVGITSAGFGCAVDHQPGIYHKVSMTVGWIIANILD